MIHDANSMRSRTILMIWDTNPKTYNKPDRETNLNSKDTINAGDRIITGKLDSGRTVFFNVKKVISVKDSSLNGYKYYQLITDRIVE